MTPLKLYIPPCIHNPRHPYHPPPLENPLRLEIHGPLVCIQKLLPGLEWGRKDWGKPEFQPGAPLLARLTFKAVYGRALNVSERITVRNEYLGWIGEPKPKRSGIGRDIDYYGVTFDYLVAEGENDPEILTLDLVEMDYDGGEFASEVLPFQVKPEEYTGKKVLAVPRCCQKRKGTQDRGRINGEVEWRDAKGYQSRVDVRGLEADGKDPRQDQSEDMIEHQGGQHSTEQLKAPMVLTTTDSMDLSMRPGYNNFRDFER
ncbi:MAG: hypothetical protein M1831_000462 [Alyxoria varia]|nr:MAG: hypothetical protein M1831_000462 [Alyxoria varia]